MPRTHSRGENMRPRTKAEQRARDRRDRAARRYKPQEIDLLLIAEAPPEALDRYFYFSDVTEQDSLFRYVARSVLKVEPTRSNKAELLDELWGRGVFLIDLFRDPIAGGRHDEQVPALVRRVRSLRPRRIILIKAPVYDAAFATLREAGLPVVNERVPFPGSGQQRRFEETFARALRSKPPKAAGKEPQERTPARRATTCGASRCTSSFASTGKSLPSSAPGRSSEPTTHRRVSTPSTWFST